MASSSTQVVTSFLDGVEDLLLRVECRPALDADQKNEIYSLRYRAYRREGALPPDAPKLFRDRFDDRDNTMTFGVYIEGTLCSSIRLHVVDKATPEHPGLHVYPDLLCPKIEAGEVLIDPTRFVVEARLSRHHPKLPYVTVRLAWMASEWFVADKLLATVRTEHQAFYKRLFGHKVLCEARPYPSLTKPLSLMALDYKSERDRVLKRYPFFASDWNEREALFGSWSKRPSRAPADQNVAMVA